MLDRHRLRFQSPQIVIDIPLAQLTIELDPEAGNQVSLSQPDQPDCLIQTFDLRLLEHSALLQQTHTRNQIRAIQSYGDLKRRLKITLWCLGGFAATALLVLSAMGLMVRALVARVPAQWEQDLGDTLLQEVKGEATFITDSNAQARLEQAAAPLIKALPKTDIEYKFYIIEEPFPNAFATPGGYVFVTTRFLEVADRPEEIAGALAHEIAHVTQKHGFRKIVSALGPYLIFKLFAGDRSGLLGVLGHGSQLLVRQSFSQDYELEADAVGWNYLVKARIDPRGLVDILRKLEVEHHRFMGLAADLDSGAFSSHPATAKRIHILEEKWKKLKDKSVFERRN